MYFWEARAILEGAALREVDTRRSLMEQAINIANISNAEKPKKAAKAGFDSIDRTEKRIINRTGTQRASGVNVDLIKQINEAFGGDS